MQLLLAVLASASAVRLCAHGGGLVELALQPARAASSVSKRSTFFFLSLRTRGVHVHFAACLVFAPSKFQQLQCFKIFLLWKKFLQFQ